MRNYPKKSLNARCGLILRFVSLGVIAMRAFDYISSNLETKPRAKGHCERSRMALKSCSGGPSDTDGDDIITSSSVGRGHRRWHRKSTSRSRENSDDELDTAHSSALPPSVKENLFNSLEDFKLQASSINKLHRRLVKQSLPDGPVNYETIFKAVSAWTTSERSHTIAKSLQKYFETPGVQVTAFRVSILFAFLNDDRSWPVVEWKEGNDTELVALFHFDDECSSPGVCSWLVHYGSGILSDPPDEARWKKTAIAWGVTDMSHLKTLFGAVQHFLGILEWSPEVALNLYCAIEPKTCSQDEMAQYAKLLFIHIHRIELLEAEFDKVAPALLKLSHTQVQLDDDGTPYTMSQWCWPDEFRVE